MTDGTKAGYCTVSLAFRGIPLALSVFSFSFPLPFPAFLPLHRDTNSVPDSSRGTEGTEGTGGTEAQWEAIHIEVTVPKPSPADPRDLTLAFFRSSSHPGFTAASRRARGDGTICDCSRADNPRLYLGWGLVSKSVSQQSQQASERGR